MSDLFESNKRRRISDTMSNHSQSPVSSPSTSSAANTSDAVTHNILNHDNKPNPADIIQFLENPSMYHPTREFMESTFVEVSK